MSFELHTKRYTFSPQLIPTLLALICIPALISLGIWQLDRADEKRVVDQKVNEAIEKPALVLNDTNVKNLENEIYRTTLIAGQYDIKQQFLLDNRTHKGIPGYHVISPFMFEHSSTNDAPKLAVLINRGWIGYKGTRDNIADISITEETSKITGTLKTIPESIVLKENEENESSSSFFFKTDSKKIDGVSLIQSIEIDRLEKKLGYPLLPVVIELDETINNGFTRKWQPYYGSIDKHNAYALQWFAMASIVLFLFFKLNIRKR